MKDRSVCLFVGALNMGGAERVMVWLAESLAGEGVDVSLITLDDGSRDRMPVSAKVRRISLGLQKRNSPLKKLTANLARVIALRRVFKQQNADTVVAFMPHESVLSILANMGSGRRTVISERNAPWRRSPGWIWSLLRRTLYRYATVQVAQTKAIGDWMYSKAKCRNVEIIPNAVQLPLASDLGAVSPESTIELNRRLMLAVGTKAYQKGFDRLIEAFAQVATAHPEWQLVIAGLDPDQEESGLSGSDVMDLVNRKGLAGRVFFPGAVGNLADWYTAADLFVLSSRFEGFPNVLIEAMAHGCASVAMDCETGPSDIIRHGKNGLLVEKQTVDALATTLSQAMSDEGLRKRLAKAGREVRDIFSPEAVMELWYSVLGYSKLARDHQK